MSQQNEEWPRPITPPAEVQELAEMLGGKIGECHALPDGSGFATVSLPLPENHWIYGKDDPVHPEHGFRLHPPPMPYRRGTDDPRREEWAANIRKATKYAVRAATMDGKEMDFDPDALVQNMVVGMLGYWTPDGLSEDDWCNPTPLVPVDELPAWVGAFLNRRTTVENMLFEMAAGKRPLPTAEECREMALKLGVPDELRSKRQGNDGIGQAG